MCNRSCPDWRATSRSFVARFRWSIIAIALVTLIGVATAPITWSDVSAHPLGQTVPIIPPTPSPPQPPIMQCPVRTEAPAGRFFDETGFGIANEKFWDYFQKRGGLRTFGYPISREFGLLGYRVQFFQRGVLQDMQSGVARINMLEAGYLPYGRINFSTFPEPDQAMIAAAPDPTDAVKALAFVRANVPDEWNGVKVGFLTAYSGTVGFADAFPDGNGDEGLLPGFNVEIWGLPTSKPAADPNNGNFVYQRFQRGILHYDASTGATQGLLLADYLKSLITGQNLPADLESQALTSRFYRQLDNSKPSSLARPQELPGTSFVCAFNRETQP